MSIVNDWLTKQLIKRYDESVDFTTFCLPLISSGVNMENVMAPLLWEEKELQFSKFDEEDA